MDIDKTKLRIFSRIGLLLVVIGFFMPIACNMNGFQLANSLETFSKFNLLSLSLYIVFIFSCLGIILPIIYFFINKEYTIKNDWIFTISIIVSFGFFVLSCVNNENNSMIKLQSGAYIIIVGLLLSLICLILYSYSGNEEINNENIQYSEPDVKIKYKNNFCTKCGSKLRDGINFCTNCGQRI